MAALSIGDFSRTTHLGVKALRNYHRVGLLVPAFVDDLTGYRSYDPAQVGDALLIKRFRDLNMSLDDIRAVLAATNVDERSALFERHLAELTRDLHRRQAAVDAVTALLNPDAEAIEVTFRVARATSGAAILTDLAAETATPWFRGAIAELRATLIATEAPILGPPTGLYEESIFTEGLGAATIYVPTSQRVASVGRIVPFVSPTVELCVATHYGSHAYIDRTYARLGEHVARHEISTPGPIRETYVTGPGDTDDEDSWVTEVGWPVFHTHNRA